MAKIQYTPAQNAAIHYGDGHLLLSAAAGSGKTAALTGRIVTLLEEGRATLDEMLIVTFTKAAAGEMKTRITKVLREKMDENRGADAVLQSRYARALSQIPAAQISTIHSFLYQSLKPYFSTLGLSQDTTIADPQEVLKLKVALMRDLVDDCFRNMIKSVDHEAFLQLADAIGQARDTTALDKELLWLAEKLQNIGQETSDLERYCLELHTARLEGKDILKTKYGDIILEEGKRFCQYYLDIFRDLEENFLSEEKTAEKYGAALNSLRAWLTTLDDILHAENTDYMSLRGHYLSFCPEKLGRMMKKDATDTSESFKYFRDAMKKDLEKFREEFLAGDCAEFAYASEKTEGILATICAVLREYETRLQKKKQAMAMMEYGDLERYATQLLRDDDGSATSVAREIGGRYKYIFVDEYQDTNREQDVIFQKLSADAVRFMVGDIKQSIYRFRGADPRVFTEYREAWKKIEPNNYADSDIATGKSLFMSENFRCSRPIIRFINAISAELLPYGGIPYEPEDALIYSGDPNKTSAPVELVLLERTRRKPGEVKIRHNDLDPEARYVARRIKDMLGKYMPDGEKIIQPSDIAILMRSPSASANEYREALREVGVFSETKTTKALCEFSSVLLLQAMLLFVDNPLRDVETAAVMRSPIFDFTINEIVTLRRLGGELPLYITALDVIAQNEGDENADESALYKKCKKLTRIVREEKAYAETLATTAYIEGLLQRLRLFSAKEVREDPMERVALYTILEAARGFDARRTINGETGLSGFNMYLKEYLEKDLEEKSLAGDQAVQIMSIHASKGLEFPICFLVETAKQRNRADETRTILLDDTLGFGMEVPDQTGLIRCDTSIRKVIGQKIAIQSVEEEMRMLYVALTRAKNCLVITGKTFDADGLWEEAALASRYTGSYPLMKEATYLNWIMRGMLKNKYNPICEYHVVAEENMGNLEENERDSDTVNALLEPMRTVDLSPKLDFTYDQRYLENIPSKLVVSRLYPEILDEMRGAAFELSVAKDELDEEVPEICFPKPAFMAGKSQSDAKQIGTATHLFFQFVDFRLLRESGFEKEKIRLVEQRFMSRRDAEMIRQRDIALFAESALLDELLQSEMLKREFRFNVRIPASNFTSDEFLHKKLDHEQAKITVQGVVDCVYRRKCDGKLVLIDYKTDAISAAELRTKEIAEHRLREKHANQLQYYRVICEKLFAESIQYVYIYSTQLGKCIKI